MAVVTTDSARAIAATTPKKRKHFRPFVLWLVPILGLLFVFSVLPIFASFFLGFFDYEVLQPLKFVGVNNFVYAFKTDPVFVKSLGNTFYYSLVSVPLGIRWDPQPGDLRTKPVKLYLGAGLGPVVGIHTGGSIDESTVFAGSRAAMTFGGFVGGGADVLLGRRWSIGVSAGYNLMADFAETIGTRKNYSGLDVGVAVGWMWGRGDLR